MSESEIIIFVGLDWSDSGQGKLAVSCECSIELSDFIKYGEFLN